MPTVNGKKFSYTPKGQAQAKAASKRTGKPVVQAPGRLVAAKKKKSR